MASTADFPSHLLPDAEDLLYEEELLRNPYSLRMWWRYLEARKKATAARRYVLYERALRALPGSYKLWKAYLTERRLAVRGMRIDAAAMESLNNTYERALVSMHKMPRIWLDYADFLMQQGFMTRTRRVFDRALAALPITQHDRIWLLYLKFIAQRDVPVDTALRVYRRYLKLEPTHKEEFIAYLRAKERWDEAARQLADALNDDTFRSLEGKSKHQLWLELCDIITRHPSDVRHLRVEPIIRGGIRKFTDEVGRLWISLADYYIRRGMFEKARDIFEEGVQTVVTVRDFSLVFDAYTQFEESLLAARMEHIGDDADADDGAAAADGNDDGSDFLLKDDGNDIDLRLARLEWLMERRAELLSSVMLRQNPHNVHEWHKRVKLFNGNTTKQILTYTQAVKTVDPEKAVGKPHTLWCAFARYYERHGDVANARVIFDKAVAAPYKYVDDLASVWSEWAEMELRHKNFQRALDVLRRATTQPDATKRRMTAEEERALPVQQRVYRSLKLWSLYCDLEESLGTLQTTRAVYDKILELRIATPQIILNYALLLQENKYFEDSFQVYERGINVFKFPHVKPIWIAYLSQFVERYKGSKLERARDLFEQVLAQAPADVSKQFYLMYADVEEKYGLAKRAMEVYERACKAVPMNERLSVYTLYIQRASEFFGIGKVREVYEMAIEAQEDAALQDGDVRTLCLRYAQLERNLGEIDRARAIFVHASWLADPRQHAEFWNEWNAFEVKHGNEDTFREMLRLKRSVAASFSQVHYNTSIVEAAAPPTAEPGTAAPRAVEQDDMQALEAAAIAATTGRALSGFVSAGTINPDQRGNAPAEAAVPPAAANPEEIDIDDGDDDDDNDGDMELEQQQIPKEVFGGLADEVEQKNKKQKTS